MGYGNVITIDSINVPNPSELKVDVEDIHAEDSGRNELGEMIIRIVARKRKLSLKWPLLSFTDGKLLTEIFESGTYHSVYYPDPTTGAWATKTFYVGSRGANLYNSRLQLWDSIEFNLIEK